MTCLGISSFVVTILPFQYEAKKSMLQISLPDGTVVSHPDDATPLSVAESIGSRLAKAVVAAKVGDRVVDASFPLHSYSGPSPIPL